MPFTAADLDAAENDNVQAQANANLAASHGVPPQQAQQAITDEPWSGVPAATGMHAPGVGRGIADANRQNAALDASPPLRNFVSQASPAHAAVLKNDLGPFGEALNTANAVGKWLNQPFDALVSDLGDSWQQIQTNVQRMGQQPQDAGDVINNLPSPLGVPFGVFNPVTRAVGSVIQHGAEGLSPARVRGEA